MPAAELREEAATASRRWHPLTLDWSRLEVSAVRQDSALFLLVASASFVESGSDLYAGNLAGLFAADPEVADWLQRQWEPEELIHGVALRQYVQRVWPEFDWPGAFRAFMDEYRGLCAVERYEPTRAQEMAARCIVEMGTTSFYQALNAVSHEPVLRQLTTLIRADEIRHYKHFYAYYRRYQRSQGPSTLRVAGSLVRRLIELRRDDADVAMRHAHDWGERCGVLLDPEGTAAQRARDLIVTHLPAELALAMTLKPLELRPWLRSAAEGAVSALARRLVLARKPRRPRPQALPGQGA